MFKLFKIAIKSPKTSILGVLSGVMLAVSPYLNHPINCLFVSVAGVLMVLHGLAAKDEKYEKKKSKGGR